MDEDLSLTEVINKEGVTISTDMHISENELMQDNPLIEIPTRKTTVANMAMRGSIGIGTA